MEKSKTLGKNNSKNINDRRMFFIKNIDDLENENIEFHNIEYEVYADGYTVGECSFGPYYFTIWEFSYKKDGEERKLCLRIKEKAYSEDNRNLLSAEKEGYYHGGDIVDEILALSSLFLRRRFKRGPKVRWNDKPMLFLKPEEWIDKPLIVGKRNLSELANWYELVKGLDNNLHQKFILAARLYHQAILIIEEQPDLAYLDLVSAIETLCREQKIEDVELHELDGGLASLVDSIENHELKDKIKQSILKKEHFICRKFREFIIENTEESFWNYEERPKQGQIEPNILRELLTRIYNQRSKTLHEGQPFPPNIFIPPLMGAELDFSKGMIVKGRRWEEKNYIPNPHFFERLVNHVLKTYLKRNQKENFKPNETSGSQRP